MKEYFNELGRLEKDMRKIRRKKRYLFSKKDSKRLQKVIDVLHSLGELPVTKKPLFARKAYRIVRMIVKLFV